MEQWKEVPGFDDLLSSDQGNIKNHGRLCRIKYERPGRDGKPRYAYVNIYRNKSTKKLRTNRLVWAAFNGPIPEGMVVDHINGDKTDNRLENLELITNHENLIRAARQGVIKYHGPAKKVIGIPLVNGVPIARIFPSITEAARTIKCNDSEISHHLSGERLTCHGWIFAYVED